MNSKTTVTLALCPRRIIISSNLWDVDLAIVDHLNNIVRWLSVNCAPDALGSAKNFLKQGKTTQIKRHCPGPGWAKIASHPEAVKSHCLVQWSPNLFEPLPKSW